jgi:hypothetical protein
VYGLFGQIEIAGVVHLIIIEEAILEGSILRANVYRVERVKFIPLKADSDMTM